ncbi:hypothetical protein CRM22_011259 [Opisthorchis felineus]|uniref:RanBP2-type domain-containing protein n=2 Tax=Opisthorchis felineus TaxID=147828 RepID=A0A4S2JYL9_OPIFE|nr:hypothetical protein CRM22_011259 [Opisthorchis felineus]
MYKGSLMFQLVRCRSTLEGPLAKVAGTLRQLRTGSTSCSTLTQIVRNSRSTLMHIGLILTGDSIPKFTYPGMQQPGQTAGYPQFHYPTASGDQSAQLLQGYAMPQQSNANPAGMSGAMFGSQSGASYNFDQSNAGYSQSPSVPVCQVGAGSQVPMQPGFAYPDFSGSFGQYAGMGQNVPSGLAAMQAGLSGDMQQFGPLMTNAFGQPMSANGAILEALAHEQGLAGFNPMAFLQDPTGMASRSGGASRGGQRGGFNKYGGTRTNSNLPSVTNPDGLREDTVFVSNLPQTIDHETMKAQFGVIGKIKINSKSGMPMVWIFKEKGVPKGEALVTYEDPQSVQAAIKYFAEHEFLGRKIEVKQAVNSQRPVILPPGGGGQNAAMGNTGFVGSGTPTNPAAALAAAAVAAAASGNTMASLMSNSAAAAASLAAFTGGSSQFDGKDFSGRGGGAGSRGGRGAMTNGRTGGSNQAGSREGDWSCAQCGNINFSWREQCNRCHVPRSQDVPIANDMPGMGRGAVGMPRGGAQGSIPVVNAAGAQPPGMPGFGRGGPVAVGGMPLTARGGRGGGPMRGSNVGVGRARPAPY